MTVCKYPAYWKKYEAQGILIPQEQNYPGSEVPERRWSEERFMSRTSDPGQSRTCKECRSGLDDTRIHKPLLVTKELKSPSWEEVDLRHLGYLSSRTT